MFFSTASKLVGLAVVTVCSTWFLNPAVADNITFDWATVGNPGNAGEVQSQGTFGSVGYAYRISKHEVTNAQYASFLNAVAATDINSLYNSDMGSNARGGITRSGSSGSFTYSVKTNMGNKPVNYVSFFDAMRFTNWLENGQGSGDTEAGVYTIGTGVNEVRQAGATYFIPSEDEWYKAAYHKNDGVTGNYWDYATSTNSVPFLATANATGDISNPGTNVANYGFNAEWNLQNGNVTTVGSAGATSASPYGTFDQTGNLWEWNETLVGSSVRGRRGGSWGVFSGSLDSSVRFNGAPTSETFAIGFRVASIPEPTSFLIFGIGMLGMFRRRRCSNRVVRDFLQQL